MSEAPPVSSQLARARWAAYGLLSLGMFACAAIAFAAWRIPSPAREIRFEEHGHAVPAFEILCYGAFFADGDRVWSICERRRDYAAPVTRYLARLDVRSGIAALLGPLPEPLEGLTSVARGNGPTRALMVGGHVVEVRGDVLRVLGTVGLPLGLAVIDDDRIEAVGQHSATPDIHRYAAGQYVGMQSLPALPVDADRIARAEYAARESDGWHVVYSVVPRVAPSLPVAVELFDVSERGASRRIQAIALGPPAVDRTDRGGVVMGFGEIQGGALVGGSIGQTECYVRRGDAFERIAFRGSRAFDSAGGVVRADGRLGRLFVSGGGTEFWLDGDRVERVIADSRFSALRFGGRTGPVLTPSFWVEIESRIFRREGGGYVVLATLENAIVRVGPDLARTDALSFAERMHRLFVEDRAKRNADFFVGAGILRPFTVPFAMLLPLFGAVGVALARSRPKLVTRTSVALIALALLAAVPFVRVLRFYW